MMKEWLIGVGVAILIFLGMLHLVQVLPVLFLIGLGVLLWMVMDRKGATSASTRETPVRLSLIHI